MEPSSSLGRIMAVNEKLGVPRRVAPARLFHPQAVYQEKPYNEPLADPGPIISYRLGGRSRRSRCVVVLTPVISHF